MAEKKLLGKGVPGVPNLSIGQVEDFLRASKDDQSPQVELVAKDICMTIMERFANLFSVTKELADEKNSHQDPAQMGFANGLITALNTINGTQATEHNLVHLPEGGFTQFNPFSVKTRPETYYSHKADGGRYHLLSKGKVKGGEEEMAIFIDLKTRDVLLTPVEDFKENYEKKEKK